MAAGEQGDLGAFTPLPNEVIVLIFKHIHEARDVCALGATGRLFCTLGYDQVLWRDLCLQYYGDEIKAINKHFDTMKGDWIWLYKSKVELKSLNGVGMKKVKNQGVLQGEWRDGKLEG